MNRFFSPLPLGQETGLTVIRLIVAVSMIYHGHEIFNTETMNSYSQWDMFKTSSFGKLMIYAGKGAELLGGILLLFGLFTRVAAVILIATLGYIAFFIGHAKIWY